MRTPKVKMQHAKCKMQNRVAVTLRFALCILTLAFPFALRAAPIVESRFPAETALLGKPLYWRINVHHPYWETFSLQLNSCPGVEMKVQQEKTMKAGAELQTAFVVRVLPRSLAIPEIPTAHLVDTDGVRTAVIGKPILIRVISGNSLQLKDPATPQFAQPKWKRKSLLLIGATVLLLSAVSLGLYVSWRWTPHRRLLRELTQTLHDTTKGDRLQPSHLLTLFRSTVLWGFEASPLSAWELEERAPAGSRLRIIAGAIRKLEEFRYSGGTRRLERKSVAESLSAAILLVKAK